MSIKGKNHNKRWLISKLKTSGSKRERLLSGDYSDTRNSKQQVAMEFLPTHEGMGKSMQFYNGKINYGLLVRFLRGNVGKEWKIVHEEILQRIPSNLSEYKECIYWFVADIIEVHDGKLWDRRTQKFLQSSTDGYVTLHYPKEFYVDPVSGILLKTPPQNP